MNRPVVTAILAVACLTAMTAGCAGDEETGGSGAEASTITVVSQNALHGNACPADTDRCHVADRLALVVRNLGRRCPELVGIQEMNQPMLATLRSLLPSICEGRYEVVADDDPGLDREVVLTTERVLGWQRFRLAGPLRTALWVRVATDVGAVDFWSTHLASSSDDRPCDPATCPSLCEPDDMLNACQARQVAQLADEHRARGGILVVGGDLNARPGEPTPEALAAAGFVDSFLAAGNRECDPATGLGCTSGRDDSSMADLTDPSSRQSERLDYLFVDATRRCEVVKRGTGAFDAEPARDDPVGLAFASDHTGVAAVLRCATTDAQRVAATRQTVPSTGTSTTAPVALDPATGAQIAEAFTAVFGGGGRTVEQKMAALENPAPLEQLFRERYAQTASVAERIVVRMDSVNPSDPDTAEVTFTLLLDGNAVLDHVPGRAVKVDGQWRVANRTFCDMASTGTDQAPAACR